MSGTGKSTVISVLRSRGYAVIETDEPGWCVPERGDWNQPDHEWIWDEPKINAALDENEHSHLFVDGCRANQGQFYDRFDEVVVLTSPLDIMLKRVATRSDNPFGNSVEQRDIIENDKRQFEPLLISGATLVIDTSTSSPDAIADRVEALL